MISIKIALPEAEESTIQQFAIKFNGDISEKTVTVHDGIKALTECVNTAPEGGFSYAGVKLYPNITAYDLEICRLIPPGKRATRQQKLLYWYRRYIRRFQYCEGWKDFDGMGISSSAYYSYADRLFSSEALGVGHHFRLAKLLMESDLVLTFNGVLFDNRLMKAYGHDGVAVRPQFDLLREIYHAKGLDPFPKDPRAYSNPGYKGYSLEKLALVNLSRGKLGRGGDLAPIWYQTGDIHKLASYNLDDCFLLRQLFELFLDGRLIDPNTRRLLTYKPGLNYDSATQAN